MRLAAALLLSAAAVGMQSPAAARAQVVYCGGETDLATVERYFAELRQALTSSAPRTRFNRFVHDQFGIRDAGGRTLYFNLSDIGSVSPGRIRIEEWREISRRGSRSLRNAGWRGCFMDHGKVAFEASRERGFRLSFFSRDMQWVEPIRGNVVP